MWGGKRNPKLQIAERFANAKRSAYGQDLRQPAARIVLFSCLDRADFLSGLYKFIQGDVLAHDSYSCSSCGVAPGECAASLSYSNSVPFPAVRPGKEHVGAVSTHTLSWTHAP